MKINENKIVPLLARLTDEELLEFICGLGIKFVSEHEDLIFNELDKRNLEADQQKNIAKMGILTRCAIQISRIKQKALAEKLSGAFTDV